MRYKDLVEQYYPEGCDKVWELMKEALPSDIEWEEELMKNFVVEIYDFTGDAKRVGGAFIKRAKDVTLRKGDIFLKCTPAGMTWVGIYGKIEFVTDKKIESDLLKKGIWFVSEGDGIFPIYPEQNEDGQYPPLTADHLKELLNEIFA